MKRFVVSLALLGACSGSTDPASDLQVRLTVEPASASLGDTVRLTVIAFNPTERTIEILPGQCGHSLVALVTEPTGVPHPLWGGPSRCPIFDDNVLSAGETDSVVWRWKAGPVLGTYSIRGGIARGTALVNPTTPSLLEVH